MGGYSKGQGSKKCEKIPSMVQIEAICPLTGPNADKKECLLTLQSKSSLGLFL